MEVTNATGALIVTRPSHKKTNKGDDDNNKGVVIVCCCWLLLQPGHLEPFDPCVCRIPTAYLRHPAVLLSMMSGLLKSCRLLRARINKCIAECTGRAVRNRQTS